MFKYDLDRLSVERFAEICDELLRSEISADVRAITLGDETLRGAEHRFESGQSKDELNGFCVFVYYHCDLQNLGASAARAQLKAAAPKILDIVMKLRDDQPDCLIILTNAPFSGRATTASTGWLQELSTPYSSARVEVWDYTTMEGKLDRSYQLRSSFSGLTYTPDFFKRVVDRVSSATLWEGTESLLVVEAADESLSFRTRRDYEAMKELLWRLYDNLSLVESGMATITNYVYSWPELMDMAEIALQHPDYKISLGDDHRIEFGRGSMSSLRNTWQVLTGLVKNIESHSNIANECIVALVERSRAVARIVAEATIAYYEGSDAMTLFRDADYYVTPLQFQRFKAVADALTWLDGVLKTEESGHQGSLEGAHVATYAFHNAILLTSGLRRGVRKALRALDGAAVGQMDPENPAGSIS